MNVHMYSNGILPMPVKIVYQKKLKNINFQNVLMASEIIIFRQMKTV